MNEVKVKWLSGMRFEGRSGEGAGVIMDSKKEPSGLEKAPTPMDTVLIALGGCTGMDVVSILEKMHVKFESLDIDIKGERTEEHPLVYKKIEIIYKIIGDVDEEKVKKAAELSMEKYCSVAAMLKKSAEIDHRVEILR
jgi:putative redox protein